MNTSEEIKVMRKLGFFANTQIIEEWINQKSKYELAHIIYELSLEDK